MTAVVVVAALWAALLGAISQPKDLKARLAAIDTRLDEAERLTKSRGDAAAYADGTVCAETGQGADALKKRIETGAAAASVALTSLAVTPASGVDAGGQLSPVRLELEASGKHEAILALLAALDRDRPAIFVDTADLKPQAGGGVTLKLNGRVLCWTSAHP
ncbi:MAG: hypothetical protein JSR45_12505 [Proteobacteria bacterium]|nr:hypothetical protein [Pseudomonadota bacterium]